MIGRLLCFVGWHRWHARSEFTRTVVITYNRCSRPGCPRYAEEFIVDLEHRAALGSGLCSCQRHAFPSPLCPVHGTQVA